jgi:hypothetical protein
MGEIIAISGQRQTCFVTLNTVKGPGIRVGIRTFLYPRFFVAALLRMTNTRIACHTERSECISVMMGIYLTLPRSEILTLPSGQQSGVSIHFRLRSTTCWL